MVKLISCALLAASLVLTGCANLHGDHKSKDCCGKGMSDCCKGGDNKPCCTMPSK
jgi:hypothetical protein